MVIRCDGDGEQRLPGPVCMVIPVSRDQLPPAELVRRHRGKQGQENAFQGPLTDLGLQHPPCRSQAAHQGFYLGGQIAQLLRLLCSRSNLWVDWLLPEGAGLGRGRRGRSRAGHSRRGPTRSPRGDPCARSRGRSGRDAGAGRRRALAGGAKSLGDGLRGPRRVRRAPRSSPTAPSTAISGN